METEVKVLTEAKVKLNHEIDAVVLELKNRDEGVEKSVEVMEKRIQEITQENQKFKQEKIETEKNKNMFEVTKAEENNPKLQKVPLICYVSICTAQNLILQPNFS